MKVLDVGASVGDVAERFRALGAEVVAVEPDPINLVCLRRNLGATVEVWPVAADEEEHRLDDLCAAAPFWPDLIKVDTDAEGTADIELLVLRGMPKVLRRARIAVVETLRHAEVVEILEEAGMRTRVEGNYVHGMR